METIKKHKSTTCTVCGKVYEQLQGLYRHQREKHNIKRQKCYHCTQCNEKFNTKLLLAAHIKGLHAPTIQVKKNRRIKCGIISCDDTFANYMTYHKHLKTNHTCLSIKEEITYFENFEGIFV